MFRLSAILILGAGLVFSTGCRCGESPGWFTSNSNSNPNNAPCRLTGNAKPVCESCYDAITGAPVPCPPAGSAMVIPGGYPTGPLTQPTMPPANELPPPSPAELIPAQPGVPFAPTSPAPGLGANLKK